MQMQKFNELIRDQFIYGGQKYALSNKRESTDVLFETFGANWLYGTMAKYCFRFKNLARERDLLKIGCYCYILWLKHGYWVRPEGLSDILDTTVDLKESHFDTFASMINDNFKELERYQSHLDIGNLTDPLGDILYHIKELSVENRRIQSKIVSIYLLCYVVWQSNYEKVEIHDTDTAKQTQ